MLKGEAQVLVIVLGGGGAQKVSTYGGLKVQFLRCSPRISALLTQISALLTQYKPAPICRSRKLLLSSMEMRRLIGQL